MLLFSLGLFILGPEELIMKHLRCYFRRGGRLRGVQTYASVLPTQNKSNKISVGQQVAQIHRKEVIGYPQFCDPLST